MGFRVRYRKTKDFGRADAERALLTHLMPSRYWDWSVDWMDLAKSSIWDSQTGMGGDGDPTGTMTVGEGRCVTDGPFAHLRPVIYNHTYVRHCLSRGFKHGNVTGSISGETYSPESIGDILREENFAEFTNKVERRLHNPLQESINGDFKATTAANGTLTCVSYNFLTNVVY